ncbi:MAG TPA: transposase, partial [Kofleriaceae bacterium]|nr:transposase [Kofleriaceae bacterium]
FREQAVALLERTELPIVEVARSLGIPSDTLGAWYRQEMTRRRNKPKVVAASAGAMPPETVQQKLARLERENAALKKKIEDLQLDRDILKKAAAFFAKESE